MNTCEKIVVLMVIAWLVTAIAIATIEVDERRKQRKRKNW